MGGSTRRHGVPPPLVQLGAQQFADLRVLRQVSDVVVLLRVHAVVVQFHTCSVNTGVESRSIQTSHVPERFGHVSRSKK